MNQLFGETYATAYDLLYQDKDYPAECELIRRILADHGSRRTRSILDLGCGTGGHALLLAQSRCQVVGVDRSESMIELARQKASDSPAGENVEFQIGDIREFKIDRQFDAVIMMFAVLGYQTENAAASAAITTARRHLTEGGLFIFDFWYGPAVLRNKPEKRVKEVPTSEGTLVRTTSTELNIRRQQCAVNFHLQHLEAGRLVSETTETHVMRFFFPREIELLLENAGLTLIRLGGFPDFEREADESTWNVLAVARAV